STFSVKGIMVSVMAQSSLCDLSSGAALPFHWRCRWPLRWQSNRLRVEATPHCCSRRAVMNPSPRSDSEIKLSPSVWCTAVRAKTAALIVWAAMTACDSADLVRISGIRRIQRGEDHSARGSTRRSDVSRAACYLLPIQHPPIASKGCARAIGSVKGPWGLLRCISELRLRVGAYCKIPALQMVPSPSSTATPSRFCTETGVYRNRFPHELLERVFFKA